MAVATKCDCGGTFKRAVLPTFDFSPFSGLPVELKRVPGLSCPKCGAETLEGTTINFVLNVLAYEIAKLPTRLNADEAKYLRKRLVLTQEQLAKRIAVDRVTVAKWEAGEKEISPHHDYILRALLITRFVAYGMLKGTDLFTSQVRRKPPAKKTELPAGVIEEIVSKLRKQNASGRKLRYC